MRALVAMGVAVLVGACAHVRKEDMGAAEHQAEVARHERMARDAESRYAAEAPVQPSFRSPIWKDPQANVSAPAPSAGERYLSLAQLSRAHAQEHAEAARQLDEARRAECGGETDVHSCPLLRGRFVRVDLLPQGVRLHAKPEVDVKALAQELRCHLAVAHYEGVDDEGSCLLFFRSVYANVTLGGRAIDLHTSDPAIAKKLHAAAQAMFRPEAAP